MNKAWPLLSRTISFYFFQDVIYLFWGEEIGKGRVREHKQRGRKGEGEADQRAQHKARSQNLSQKQTLNCLSRPGAPQESFKSSKCVFLEIYGSTLREEFRDQRKVQTTSMHRVKIGMMEEEFEREEYLEEKKKSDQSMEMGNRGFVMAEELLWFD